MKELIIELKKQNYGINREDGSNLKSVKCGNYEMSVQGSSGHYCDPREILDIERYFSMELALFGKEGNWLHIHRSSILKKFNRYNELFERISGENSRAPVFGYVPVDLLNDLYIY